MKSPLIVGFPIWLFAIDLSIYLYLSPEFLWGGKLKYIYRLHFATLGIPLQIYIGFSLNVSIPEKKQDP